MKKFNLLLVPLLLFACTKPLPDEIGLKEINGTKLFVRAIGNGEPLLVIHGGPGLSQQYLLDGFENLRDNYRLIFYDQRASGQSDMQVDPQSVTLINFLEDIEALRKSMGIEKLNLLAHSWGGTLAMKYAAKYPDQMKSLILVNSVGASTSINNTSNVELAKRFTTTDSLQRANLFASDAFQRREPKAIETLMKIGFRHQFVNKNLLDSLDLALNENFMQSNQLLQNLGMELMDYDFHKDIEKITCPTLLIYGSYDPLNNLAGSALEAAIPNATLQVIEESGHFPFIEQKEEFEQNLTRFLK